MKVIQVDWIVKFQKKVKRIIKKRVYKSNNSKFYLLFIKIKLFNEKDFIISNINDLRDGASVD